MAWNNEKIKELLDKNNKEASKLYEEYEKNKKSNKENIVDSIDTLYSQYSENKNSTKENIIDSFSDLETLYSNYKSEKIMLTKYKIVIGNYTIPITPENIEFKNPTEPKTFKLASGKVLVIGVVVLPREVTFSSYFPYFDSSTTPYEFLDIFENLKNEKEIIKLKIEGTGKSFNAWISQFDYTYIPGRDIDYTITLCEYVEVTSDVLDI